MPFHILSDKIDAAVPSRAKPPAPKPVTNAYNAPPAKPGMATTRSKDPKVQAEIARRMAAQSKR